MTHSHAVVWLDFREARIYKFNDEDAEKKRIRAHTPHRQVHHRAGTVDDGHVRDNREYFEAIIAELEGVREWMIVGPGETRHDLRRYLDDHAEELRKKLVGFEPMDHPTDGELLAHARRAFKAIARITPTDPRIKRALGGGTARG